MGLEDRQYYRHENYGSNRGFSFGQQSIVTTIVIINVVIFLLDAFSGDVPDGSGTGRLSSWLGVRSDHPFYFWTYLTHGFAHASYKSDIGIWHIAGNMITLWFLGRPVEHRLGKKEFLRFYLAAIVVSGLGFALLRLAIGQPFFVVGASGGVSAVVALFIFMYPREKILLFAIIPMPAWLLGVLLLLSNFMTAFNPGSHIAWEAHLVGAAFGAVYYLRRWNLSQLDFGGVGKILKPRPKLKVHNPSVMDEKLKSQADQILEKISQHGEESLTSRERKTLNKYSEKLRKSREG